MKIFVRFLHMTAVALFMLCLPSLMYPPETAFADQLAALSRTNAEKAVALLKKNYEDVRKLCEPAGNYWPTSVMIFDAEDIASYKSGNHWYVRMGGEEGEEFDFAYTYIKEGDRWVNAAHLLGLKPEGVTISFTDPKLWISEPASGYVRLTVTKDGENMRGLPSQHSPIVSTTDKGDILIAEAKIIKSEEDGSEWYRIVAYRNERSELKLAANSMECAFIHPVLPVKSVKAEPLDEDSAARMEWYHSGRGTPPKPDSHFIADSARDWSESAQRAMAEKKFPLEGEASGTKIAVTDPAKTKGESLKFLSDSDYLPMLAITSKQIEKTEWYLLTDRSLRIIGWVSAGDFRASSFEQPGVDRFYYHFTNLCRNLDATLPVFGPLTGRRQDANFGDEPEEVTYFITQNFDGANFSFNILSRDDENIYPMGGSIWGKGKGIGGIFIGAKWCDKAYVKRLLSEPQEIGNNEDGDEEWFYFDEGFRLWVTFDGQGLVKQIYVHMGGN